MQIGYLQIYLRISRYNGGEFRVSLQEKVEQGLKHWDSQRPYENGGRYGVT